MTKSGHHVPLPLISSLALAFFIPLNVESGPLTKTTSLEVAFSAGLLQHLASLSKTSVEALHLQNVATTYRSPPRPKTDMTASCVLRLHHTLTVNPLVMEQLHPLLSIYGRFGVDCDCLFCSNDQSTVRQSRRFSESR